MFNLSEYRRRQTQLSDYLPWAALVASGIVLNKDGSLQRTLRFRGPDLDSAIAVELSAISQRLNSLFRRLGEGWSLFIEAQRIAASDYPQSVFDDPASALVDAERRAAFEAFEAHFESRYFLTLVYLPPQDLKARGQTWLFEGGASGDTAVWDRVSVFQDQTERVRKMIEGLMPECDWLDNPGTLTYLHSTVSTRSHTVAPPEVPMHLDALLADQPLTGGLSPKLGDHHLRILSITGFPGATVPGLLDDLNRLGFAYRWSTRALLMDKVSAGKVLTRIRRQWFAKRKSVGAILKEVMTNEASALVDNDAANKAADADAALQDLGADLAGYAYVTITLVVSDADANLADEKARLLEKTIQARDCVCVNEGLNAVDAWLGSLPGHLYANVRRPPISTLNLAHLMPVSAVWAGPDHNGHLNGPPLCFAKTEGSTPFRLSLHVGDVGHTLVIGPTGAGKSVLLALLALQFRRYAGAQVFAFDFGRSLRAAGLAMGGDWHDLGEPEQGNIRLQPLRRIDETAECAWASDWLCDLLAREGIETTPDVKAHLWSALCALESAPADQRTLSGLCALIQSLPLKQALKPYCLEGSNGALLDNDADTLSVKPIQIFETQGLIGTPAAASVLSYLFHRIEGQLDGRPTFIVVDEGWLALDDPTFSGRLKEWLKTLRKANASVLFATQSLADIERSAISAALIESCPSRLFLPNAAALEPGLSPLYQRFGLNDRQIEIIAHAQPRRDYYLQSPLGNRLFDLDLGDVALSLCASASKADQTDIDRIVRDHGRDAFLPAWLRFKGVEWAAALISSPAQPEPSL